MEAGLLSSFWAAAAYASTDKGSLGGVVSGSVLDNSQTLALLSAGVSYESVNKGTKENKNSKETPVVEGGNVQVADNALVPSVGALSGTGGVDVIDESSPDDISVYVIRKGDSISQIAEMFDVSVNTILWANDLKKGAKLEEGDVLFILPISGIEHTVKKGETLKGIANMYKADPGEIAAYNGVPEDAPLAIGDKLIVPDAVREEENDKPVKNLKASIAKDNKYYEAHPKKNLSGYYVNPVPGYRKSQGIHDKNAVDLAISTGTPIHAAASGKVILARNGYNGGYGNLVIIAHPNGTETLYAHQSRIGTTTGAQVKQGQVIGYVGSTGRSTGPHLHFEVHGARNPGADASWAN